MMLIIMSFKEFRLSGEFPHATFITVDPHRQNRSGWRIDHKSGTTQDLGEWIDQMLLDGHRDAVG